MSVADRQRPAGVAGYGGVSVPAPAADTLADILLDRTARSPDAVAFRFLGDGREETARQTYADLDREARAVAAALRDVAGPGDRALLLFDPGLDFLSAFFGCQYAGVIPVPSYPPRPGRDWSALSALAADCTPRAVLTDREVGPHLPDSAAVPALAGIPRIMTDDLDPSLGRRWRRPPADPDGLALLQYTSGSTAAPKGVAVTHRNLLHNQAAIRDSFGHDASAVDGVSWLPPYHDMGLVGGLLQAVYRGATCTLLSPFAFLRDPLNWLRAVARYRAHTSVGPVFAYDLCVRRSTPEQRAALDLSHWRVAAVGAEPVRADTLRRFAEAFAPAGFRPEAFFPCYGLAEATLLVTGGPRSAPPELRHLDGPSLDRGRVVRVAPDAARTVVGCGTVCGEQDVRVVDPDARLPRADGEVGEVWVRGPSVARGYWNQPAETERTFRATLRGTGEGPYLRTGDLGFFDGGQLFVTGRIKDLIVIHGRNHHPEDLEATAQAAHPGLRPGAGAAFEVGGDGVPRVVLVQEVDRGGPGFDPTRAAEDVRQAVAERHGLQVADFVFVAQGSIPKTSSGKVRRHACRAAYEADTLRRWNPRGEP